MKKRITATLIAFCMILSLLPVSALAADLDSADTEAAPLLTDDAEEISSDDVSAETEEPAESQDFLEADAIDESLDTATETATATATDDGEKLSVIRAEVSGWSLLLLTEQYTTPDYLEAISSILPRTVNVTLSDGQTVEAPVQREWEPDAEHLCWTNSVDRSVFSQEVDDSEGILNSLSVSWQVDSYTGSFSLSPSTQLIGQEGTFSLRRYMLDTNRVEFWQIPADGGPAILRATAESEGASNDRYQCSYAIDAWTAEDAGQWLGVYGFSYGGSMYLAGVQEAAPKTYTVTLRPSGGVLQGPEIYQTVFSGGIYHLETVPPDPVRTNYRFEGWYTQSTGGESVSVTTQTSFTEDTILYAHWSRLGGSGADSVVSDGKELQTTTVTGVSGVARSVDNASYSNYGWLMFGNLYRNSDGTFITVDGNAGESVVVTFWDQNFQQTEQKQLPMELSLFGGFYHGDTYNYLVFGQENIEEDNEKEVLRVVKYDQDFNRVSAAAVRDCYTYEPLYFGSCRMAEAGNHLTVHTTRHRYLTPDDGLRHQSQLTIVINTDTMEVENDLGAFQSNHVSHSFNQFVLYDGENHVLLDHGDAYPRSVVLQQAYNNGRGTSYREIDLLKIPGTIGDNWTGVSVGGFAQSDDFYLATINTVRQDKVSYSESGGHTLDSDERDVVLLSCSKYMDSGSVRQDSLTDYYQTGATAGVPYMVPIGDNRYVILWQEFSKTENQYGYYSYESKGVRYAVVNGNADLLTEAILLPNAQLSRYCQPVADGKNVVWYVDAGGASGTRTFYRLSLDGGIDNPNDNPNNPSDDPDNPGDNTDNPGDNTDNPGDNPDNPGDNTDNPGDNTDNPGDNPDNPGDNPDNPGDNPDNPNTPGNPNDPDNPTDQPGQKSGIHIVGLKESYEYTGAKVIPDIKVYDYSISDEIPLVPGTDYTVKYKDNVKPISLTNKKATVIVTGKGNYAGKSQEGYFAIEENKSIPEDELLDLKGAKLDKIAPVSYNTKAQYPDFTLTLKDQTPVTYTYNDNYGYYVELGTTTRIKVNVAVSNNINKGTATILLTGKNGSNNKATTLKKTFKITALDISSAMVTADPATYAVKGAVPSATVTIKVNADGTEVTETLIPGIDYTAKYASNKKAGTKGIIKVTGKGNYAGKAADASFDINTLAMNDLKIAVAAYEGVKADKLKATVLDSQGNALKASQYTVEVSKNEQFSEILTDKLNGGEYVYVRAVAKDTTNLTTGTKTEVVKVKVGKNFAKATVKLKKDGSTNKPIAKTYTGDRIELDKDELEVTMKGETGEITYEIVGYTNNIKKGTATAILQGTGEYTGTKAVKFKIVAKSMTTVSFDSIKTNIKNFINDLLN